MRGSTSVLVLVLALTGCAGEGGTGNTDPGGDFGDFGGCDIQIVEVWNPNHGHSVFTYDFEQQIDEQEFNPYQRIEIGGGRAGHTHTIDPRNNPRVQAFIFGETASVTVETEINSLHSHKVTVSLSVPPGCGDVFDDGFDGDGPPPVPPGGVDDG